MAAAAAAAEEVELAEEAVPVRNLRHHRSVTSRRLRRWLRVDLPEVTTFLDRRRGHRPGLRRRQSRLR